MTGTYLRPQAIINYQLSIVNLLRPQAIINYQLSIVNLLRPQAILNLLTPVINQQFIHTCFSKDQNLSYCFASVALLFWFYRYLCGKRKKVYLCIMENYTEREILEKILLPLNRDWEVSEISTDEIKEEIFVKLHYKLDYVEANGIRYPLYDQRKERKWRHLDLWQYKTYLVAALPRYKDAEGSFKTVSIPWAEEYERMTVLLEKKR
jgi:hypothetical protein